MMADHPTCIGCGVTAPDANSTYTLISATHGWRLTRRILADGTRGVEWRCPTCWTAHKNGQAATKPGAPAAASAAATRRRA
jgi:hypothetical protein